MGSDRILGCMRTGRLGAVGPFLGCALAPLGRGRTALAASDWTTINEDCSSQRYVDLDEMTPANIAPGIRVRGPMANRGQRRR